MKRIPNGRKLARIEKANIRAAARAERTPEEQLAILDARGFGDCKEATRIKNSLSTVHETVTKKPEIHKKSTSPKPRHSVRSKKTTSSGA